MLPNFGRRRACSHNWSLRISSHTYLMTDYSFLLLVFGDYRVDQMPLKSQNDVWIRIRGKSKKRKLASFWFFYIATPRIQNFLFCYTFTKDLFQKSLIAETIFKLCIWSRLPFRIQPSQSAITIFSFYGFKVASQLL